MGTQDWFWEIPDFWQKIEKNLGYPKKFFGEHYFLSSVKSGDFSEICRKAEDFSENHGFLGDIRTQISLGDVRSQIP